MAASVHPLCRHSPGKVGELKMTLTQNHALTEIRDHDVGVRTRLETDTSSIESKHIISMTDFCSRDSKEDPESKHWRRQMSDVFLAKVA